MLNKNDLRNFATRKKKKFKKDLCLLPQFYSGKGLKSTLVNQTSRPKQNSENLKEMDLRFTKLFFSLK